DGGTANGGVDVSATRTFVFTVKSGLQRGFRGPTPPVEAEAPVNRTTTATPYGAAVACDADGDYVVVWQGNQEAGQGYNVYAQRFNSAGGRQGPEFRVNTYTASDQSFPSVAMDAAGDFVVTWTSVDQDGWGYGVYARRYSASGAPREPAEFRV